MTRSSVVAPLTAAARQERARRMSLDGEKAWAEQEASSEATEAKTKRLRAMRLEREGIENALPKAASATRAKKAAVKTIRRNIPL